MMKRFYIMTLLSVALVSCSQLEVPESLEPGTQAEVQLTMDVIGEIPVTKEVVDKPVTNETKLEDIIHNFWIIQYDGASDNARIVGEPKYYDMASFKNSSEGLERDVKVNLVASSETNRIVVLANTFDPLLTFPKSLTYAGLKSMWKKVEDTESFLAENNGKRYIIFSGSALKVVSAKEPISIPLKRNVAKVNIQIINSSQDVTINSIQLRSIPSVSFYLADYALPDAFPAINEFDLVDFPLHRFETPLAPGSVATKEYYLPVNKRGEVTNDLESKKNYYAPNAATYLQINASYSGGVPIEYTFYLGENLTDDFNILPNRSYTYVFNITQKGDAKTDYRVKELGLVDFTKGERANCYIINPAQTEGVAREFMVPVDRVDKFWGGQGYENSPNYTLGTSKEWTVRVIAMNFDNSQNLFSLTKDKGKGNSDYFKFTVKPGAKGNVIVALYVGDVNVCWSWHLWITDYMPDEAYSKVPKTGEYIYPVTGGAVHRYGGTNTIWQGEYANRFIMDRNLGAWDTKYNGTGNGTLYYQFGRKDPMFGSSSTGIGSFGVANIASDGLDASQTVLYAIHNPLKIIYPGERKTWTTDTDYNTGASDKTVIWFDPQTSSVNGMNPGGKSIFDPCPPGYCVPKNGTWADFRMNTSARPTTNVGASTNIARGFPSYEQNNVCYYWPYPDTGSTEVPKEMIAYPTTGFKESSTGVSMYSGYTYMYASSINNSNTSYSLKIYPNELSTAYGFQHNLAFPVRCVTSSDSVANE